MASPQYDPKTGKARILFRYATRLYSRTVAVASEREALRVCARVDDALQDLKLGKLVMPPDADPATFIFSAGKLASKPAPVAPMLRDDPGPPTLKTIFDIYAATLTPGSKESNSLDTEAIHRRHFLRLLSENRKLDGLGADAVQGYVDARAGEGVGRQTIRKELSTLRVILGWALKRRHLASPTDWKIADLTFPKSAEKPPFQTWEQIAKRIDRGGISKGSEAELWEALWLNQEQTLECLNWVQEHASYGFLHPMFAFAAFTGARRSEMLRSERDDWDFESGVVSIRQKKADRSKTFTRRSVPIHSTLASIMGDWFENGPNSRWAISTDDGAPIGPRMATKYFRGAVKGGKWAVLHGWHTFRHSLASNMASAGVDQRVINEILGHHTEEMERRYRHLLPQKQAHALGSLFKPA